MQATNNISPIYNLEQRDPDGFYSFKAIQSMTTCNIQDEYTFLKENKRDPLQFLAKVSMAAQKLNFENEEA